MASDPVGDFINNYGALIAVIVILSMGAIGTWEVANTLSATSSAQEEVVFCTQDVKLCPDGSSVARDPANNCEFRACPEVINETAAVEEPAVEQSRLSTWWCTIKKFFGGTCVL